MCALWAVGVEETLRADKLAGDVALEAYEVAASITDADGLHTDNELLAIIETFGPLLPTQLTALFRLPLQPRYQRIAKL